MTDEQILDSLQNILNRIHDDKHGIFQNNSKFKNGIIKTKLAITRNIPLEDVQFNVSGDEILTQKFGDLISCTGMTKAFLSAGKNSGLDLKAVITVNVDALNKGETNNDHVVPAVRMSDGAYHMIEPRCRSIHGDCKKLLARPVKIGDKVFHILNSMKDSPYEVVAIIGRDELERIKSLKAVKFRNHRPGIIPQTDNQR